MNAKEATRGTSNSSTPEEKTMISPELQPWIDRWLPTLSHDAKRYHRRETISFVIAGGLVFVGMGVTFLLLGGEVSFVALLAMIFGGAILFWGILIVLNLVLVSPLDEGRQEQIEEIRAAIQQHNLPAAEIVRRIGAEIKSCKYRDEVMEAIDPAEATLLINHDEVLALLEAFSQAIDGKFPVFEKIGQVSQLQNYAYSYAKAGFYAEAIAVLSAAELLYKTIAAAAPQLQWRSDNMSYTAEAPWAAFSFRDEVSRLSAIVARRKAVPQALEALKAVTGQAEVADLLDVDPGVSLEIRDQELIGKCAAVASMYGAMIAATGGMETILTLSYMPGYGAILDAAASMLFKGNLFVPQLVEACIRRGAEMESTLLNLLEGDTANERFNAALALGIMHSGEGAEAARRILGGGTDALTWIGALFILVHSGETQRQEEILPYLDDKDEMTAHAAAIALEHLPMPVPDATLEKHLRDNQNLVKLRLTRHVRQHPDVGSAVQDAVSELVTDADDQVGMAAAETMSVLLSGDELFDLARDRLGTTRQYRPGDQSIRRRLFLMAGRAGTQAAVDLLLKEWDAAGQGQRDEEHATHILSCLGETGSGHVVPVLIKAIEDKDHKLVALQALLAVARQRPGQVRSAAIGIQDDVIRLFVRALLSEDGGQVEAFKKKLGTAVGDQRGLALQLAAVLAHPALEDALDDLRTATLGNEVRKPTWRYLAAKASFAVLIAGVES